MPSAATWWRWRDSNPRPKNHSFDFLRAHPQFCSPRWGVRRTTPHWERRIGHDGLCAAHPFMFTANRRPNRSRGTLRQDGCLVKQQEQLYCCRLFLRFGAFKEVLRFRPLIGVQIPRRNPFIPVLCKKKAYTVFGGLSREKRRMVQIPSPSQDADDSLILFMCFFSSFSFFVLVLSGSPSSFSVSQASFLAAVIYFYILK